jgi:hypothetical protein
MLRINNMLTIRRRVIHAPDKNREEQKRYDREILHTKIRERIQFLH